VRGEACREVIVGPDLRNGHRVQLLIPGNTFHTARLIRGPRWFLGASTEWPDVVPAQDVEIGKLDEIAAKYPPSRVICEPSRHLCSRSFRRESGRASA